MHAGGRPAFAPDHRSGHAIFTRLQGAHVALRQRRAEYGLHLNEYSLRIWKPKTGAGKTKRNLRETQVDSSSELRETEKSKLLQPRRCPTAGAVDIQGDVHMPPSRPTPQHH